MPVDTDELKNQVKQLKTRLRALEGGEAKAEAARRKGRQATERDVIREAAKKLWRASRRYQLALKRAAASEKKKSAA